MSVQDVTDPQAVLKAVEEFKSLGREGFLAKYGFKQARQYLLEVDGLLYDSKAILGAAHGYQFPERGPLAWNEFSGGEKMTRPKLTELGFTVVNKLTRSEQASDEALPVGDLIDWVLSLQKSWSSDNTPEMHERGQLIRTELPLAITALLPEPGSLPFAPEVEGRDATGKKSRVPWVRVFSKAHSPSAMKGWYVVLLFAADGSRAYLTLGSGTSTMESGTFKPQSAELLADRVEWARATLASADTAELLTKIDLADRGSLGQQYERGTVYAYGFDADAERDDEEFGSRLHHLLNLLSVLYTHDRPEDEDLSPAVAGVVHLLLKWSQNKPETLDEHLAVAAVHDGNVWWGNWTDGTKRIAEHRVRTIRDQISAGATTYAYLYRSGPEPMAWRAEIQAITNSLEEVDRERLPPSYPDVQQHSVYVLLHDILPIGLDWMRDHLALASKPIVGSLTPGLKTQTSPLFVIDLEQPVSTAGDEPASSLTKEWLVQRTLWDVDLIDELLEVLLGSGPQVILAGPPGTGKSWVAQAVARYLTNDRATHWRLVQFHPSYGYESFIEGLRPVADKGAISFERVDGTVIRMAKTARLGDLPYVLILDEMNRANVPRVLGELMFLFEYRNQTVDLQYSQGFSLPKNLCFIATMNTADRSIRSIDVALRRRFEIFECLPDFRALERFYSRNLGANYVPDLVSGFVALNEALTSELDRHHTIGQSFFMAAEMSPIRLRRTWARQVRPLIEEYFFDQPEVSAEFDLIRFWPKLDA